MILLVSADEGIRAALEKAFGQRRRVLVSNSINNALARLLLERPALLVCDSAEPHPDALDQYRKLIQTAWDKSTPVLVITGWRDLLFHKRHFLNPPAGPTAVLFRPFDEILLVRETDHLLSGCNGQCSSGMTHLM